MFVSDLFFFTLRTHPTNTPQPPAILGSLDVLAAALKLSGPSQALQLLVRCPALLYDITIPAIQARMEQLSVVLAFSSEEARGVALQQPVSLLYVEDDYVVMQTWYFWCQIMLQCRGVLVYFAALQQ